MDVSSNNARHSPTNYKNEFISLLLIEMRGCQTKNFWGRDGNCIIYSFILVQYIYIIAANAKINIGNTYISFANAYIIAVNSYITTGNIYIHAFNT